MCRISVLPTFAARVSIEQGSTTLLSGRAVGSIKLFQMSPTIRFQGLPPELPELSRLSCRLVNIIWSPFVDRGLMTLW